MEVNQEVSGMINDLVRESLGSVLTVAREKKKLSIREVAEHLKLMPYQIESLEKEDFAVFNAEIFIKSYLRNYATLLDIDPSVIIDLYDENHRVDQAPPVVRRPIPMHMPCKKRYIGVFAVFLIVIILWLLNGESGSDVATQNISELESTAVQASSDVSSTEQETAVPSESAINSAAALEYFESLEVQRVPNAALEAAAKAESAAKGVPQKAITVAEAISDKPEHHLDLVFTGECWVEIKDAAGKVLLADLKRSGDEVHIEGEAPFNILLGYAPAVQLSYNGERVEINTENSRESAKLVVGSA